MSTKFIAEVSSNHSQDLSRCLDFIDESSRIGCDSVKFQLFKVDQLFAPEVLERSEKLRRRKDWELPVEFLPRLAERCKQRGLEFSCTPFYLEAVQELEPYVDFYKIASYELLWDELIRACSVTGKPLVLSTGMANLAEIEKAVRVAQASGCQDLTLLHCISGYPTPANECNLANIATLRSLYQCGVGWSDHTVSPAVLYRAVNTWGAQVIEFHLDLEGHGAEYEAGHCWLPDQMKEVIDNVRVGRTADGSGDKQIAPIELRDRDWRADPKDGLRPLSDIRSSCNP